MQVGRSIRWGQANAGDFAYGSQIIWQSPDEVYFENALMPSGKQITSWSSRSFFQMNKESATLPMIRRGAADQLFFLGQSSPQARVFFKVSFYDYYGSLIEESYLRKRGDYFKVPENYNAYAITMQNGGCRAVDFRQIILRAYEEKRAGDFEQAYALHVGTKTKYLIFDELGNGPQIASLRGSHTPYSYITSRLSKGQLYLREEARELVDQAYRKQDQLTLVGYGPISNIAALYHGERLSCPTLITEDLLTEADYLSLHASLGLDQTLKGALANYKDLLHRDGVRIYAPGQLQSTESVSAFLQDYKPQLKHLGHEGEFDAKI